MSKIVLRSRLFHIDDHGITTWKQGLEVCCWHCHVTHAIINTYDIQKSDIKRSRLKLQGYNNFARECGWNVQSNN